MGRIVSVGLLMLVGSGVAHARGRHETWRAVEHLGHGVPVEVQLRGEAGTDSCLVVSADDSSLTCVREQDPDVDWDAASGARLVFPRSAVRNVWLLTTSSPHPVTWILTGVAVALFIAACAEGNILGALIEAGIVAGLAVAWNDTVAAFRPRPPHLHPRLIYRSATP